MILLLSFAFSAGLVTVLSPCILPILPVILTSTLGSENIGKARPFGVVVGFILSFTFFTLFLSTLVRILGIPGDLLRVISIIVIAVFGFSLLIPAFQLFIETQFSKLASLTPNGQNKTGFLGGLIIGLSVGLLWTPCVGPILASVISLALTGAVTLDAVLITLAYSVGTAIPMFLIIYGGQNVLRKIPWLFNHLGQIQKVFGVIMIMTAIAIFLNLDRKFQTFVLNTFPQYGTGLTRFEDNKLVKDVLEGKSAETNLVNSMREKAPEIIPGGNWFNNEPLSLEKLRGKVVLIDFWTYSCINCQRTLPYLRSWNDKYKDKGLVIIGVHAPEFEFEKNPKNVEKAIKDFQLTYPIVQDNDFATWKAYNNRYWPAKYFIDKDGNIRYQHFGEGDYDESEKVIQKLLMEAGATNLSSINNPSYTINANSPESYLGYGRIENYASPEEIKRDSLGKYSMPKVLENNTFAYEGEWNVMKEYANPQAGAKLFFKFDAKEVYLVMKPKEGEKMTKIKVYVDGKMQNFGDDVINGEVTVTEDTLYKLVKLEKEEKHQLMLEFKDSNAQLFAFTFG